jgi:hypothetical protein
MLISNEPGDDWIEEELKRAGSGSDSLLLRLENPMSGETLVLEPLWRSNLYTDDEHGGEGTVWRFCWVYSVRDGPLDPSGDPYLWIMDLRWMIRRQCLVGMGPLPRVNISKHFDKPLEEAQIRLNMAPFASGVEENRSTFLLP